MSRRRGFAPEAQVARGALLLTLSLAGACTRHETAPPAAPVATPAAFVALPLASSPGPSEKETTLAPASAETPALSAAIDEKAVAVATGVEKPEKSPDGVVKASFPRTDVEVLVDGWKVAPFVGLTSWVAFTPGRKGVAEAMIMGDLVLFEDEINPVLSVLLDHHVQVTAIHNHFFYDVPRVFFMHVGGEGTIAALGAGARAAMDKVAEIRKKAPKPAHGYGLAGLPVKNTIDGAKLEALLGVKGQVKDGTFKATMGRSATASCGCVVGKTMGVNTWAAFAGSDENAVVDGDFAVVESELQPVLRALRAGGVNIVAIHHHMSGESPRILFLHYWGRGKALDLAATVKAALDLTAWDRPKPETT
jgi:hypothetical protein